MDREEEVHSNVCHTGCNRIKQETHLTKCGKCIPRIFIHKRNWYLSALTIFLFKYAAVALVGRVTPMRALCCGALVDFPQKITSPERCSARDATDADEKLRKTRKQPQCRFTDPRTACKSSASQPSTRAQFWGRTNTCIGDKPLKNRTKSARFVATGKP